jgi:hypothetical protein
VPRKSAQGRLKPGRRDLVFVRGSLNSNRWWDVWATACDVTLCQRSCDGGRPFSQIEAVRTASCRAPTEVSGVGSGIGGNPQPPFDLLTRHRQPRPSRSQDQSNFKTVKFRPGQFLLPHELDAFGGSRSLTYLIAASTLGDIGLTPRFDTTAGEVLFIIVSKRQLMSLGIRFSHFPLPRRRSVDPGRWLGGSDGRFRRAASGAGKIRGIDSEA